MPSDKPLIVRDMELMEWGSNLKQQEQMRRYVIKMVYFGLILLSIFLTILVSAGLVSNDILVVAILAAVIGWVPLFIGSILDDFDGK